MTLTNILSVHVPAGACIKNVRKGMRFQKW